MSCHCITIIQERILPRWFNNIGAWRLGFPQESLVFSRIPPHRHTITSFHSFAKFVNFPQHARCQARCAKLRVTLATQLFSQLACQQTKPVSSCSNIEVKFLQHVFSILWPSSLPFGVLYPEHSLCLAPLAYFCCGAPASLRRFFTASNARVFLGITLIKWNLKP